MSKRRSIGVRIVIQLENPYKLATALIQVAEWQKRHFRCVDDFGKASAIDVNRRTFVDAPSATHPLMSDSRSLRARLSYIHALGIEQRQSRI